MQDDQIRPKFAELDPADIALINTNNSFSTKRPSPLAGTTPSLRNE
jgi:hypothetical protein